MADSSHLALTHLFSVRGLVALVTGGATGIGLMITQTLAANGARDYIVGRRQEALDEVVRHYGAGVEGEIIALQGDVSQKKDIQRLVQEIEKREGGLHILVNNAGVVGPITKIDKSRPLGELCGELFDESPEDWNRTFEINNHAIYFTTVAFLPLLAKFTNGADERGRAICPNYQTTVINISSISGYVKYAQNHFAYNASKGAANHLHRMLATEFAHTGIRFNCLAPGLFPSEMTGGGPGSSTAGKTTLDGPFNGHGLVVPGQRAGTIEEIGGTVLYLCSRAGQFTCGVILPVDGATLTSNPSCY